MATYFIAPFPTGNDLIGAGTAGSPWANMSKAETVVVAGDTVHWAAGSYTQPAITLSKAGASGNVITYIADGAVTLNVNGSIDVTGGFRVLNGFTMVCNTPGPIRLLGATNNTISNCTFSGTFVQAVVAVSASNLMLNLTVTQPAAVGYGLVIGADAVGTATSASNNVIDNARIIGTNAAGNIHGILVGGGGSNNIVKNCYIQDTYYGIVDKGEINSLIFNNIINLTRAATNNNTGIYCKASIGSQYFHNTCRSPIDGFAYLIQEDDPSATGQDPSGCIFRNNIGIILTTADPIFAVGIPGVGSFSSDHNCYQYPVSASNFRVTSPAFVQYPTLAAWTAATGKENVGSIAATPTFTGSGMTQKSDYTPQSGSPVINAGVALTGAALAARTTDALGQSIIGVPDMGAVEFQGGGPNIPPVSNAGPDRAISLPTNIIVQTGSGSDSDGTIAGYLWTQVSGPNTATIGSPTNNVSTFNNLVVGVYVFNLRVTDNLGAIGNDTFQVTVTSAPGRIFYISLSGNDTWDGTQPAFVSGTTGPWRNWERMNSVSWQAGDTVYIRAGTYNSIAPASTDIGVNFLNVSVGTASAPITIAAYPSDFVGVNARVTYNFNNIVRDQFKFATAIETQNCKFINYTGLKVISAVNRIWTGPGNDGTSTISGGFAIDDSHDITYTNCESTNGQTGFALLGTSAGTADNVTYINCDAHDNDDPLTTGTTSAHGNSDGFGRTNAVNTASNTQYYYCRSWVNSDDGWDCFGTVGTIFYYGCWSFQNGYYNGGATLGGDGNGFKMGPSVSSGLRRTLHNCLAMGNTAHGFDQNTAQCTFEIINCSSINNGGNDWKFGYTDGGGNFPPHVFKNNLSFGCCSTGTFPCQAGMCGCTPVGGNTPDGDHWVETTNSWNTFSPALNITAADFQSFDLSLLKADRQPDGSLPVVATARLANGSDLIDRGTAIPEIPFCGSAPELGAFEVCAAAVTPKPYSFGMIIV